MVAVTSQPEGASHEHRSRNRLFVIGAILVFAVNVDTSQFVDLDLIGYILMGAGVSSS
jgi:hypothetical protein